MVGVTALPMSNIFPQISICNRDKYTCIIQKPLFSTRIIKATFEKGKIGISKKMIVIRNMIAFHGGNPYKKLN